MQKKRILELNQAIDVGFQQLQSGQKINAQDVYQRLKQKIEHMRDEKK